MEDIIKEIINELDNERMNANSKITRSAPEYFCEEMKGYVRGLSYAISILENDSRLKRKS